MKTVLIFLVAVACVSVATPMDEDPVSTRMLFCHNLTLTYIFNKPSLTQEDVNALGKCRKESAFFFLRKFGMNYKHLDEFKSRFERDRPELLEGLNDGVGAFFKKLNSTQTLNDLVDFDRYLYRHNLPTFEIPFAHIRDIVADVASPLYEKPVKKRMYFCHILAFTYFSDTASLTRENVNALGKCRRESETFFAKKFGINYKDLNEIKARFERDRPELLEALDDGFLAFIKKLKGTQTLKDLIEFNRYLHNHNLPTFEDVRKEIGLPGYF